ncbi:MULTISPECIES: hypothetical protein, partial [unclassified Acinetobacter]|uniref:hypothetical protein n=2 Tax=unclassified Acinetobacter TaxID=196816 RepID=UPI001C5542E3
ISKRPNFWGLFLSFSEAVFLFLGEKRGSVHSLLLSENDKSPKPLKVADRQLLKYQIFTHGLKPPKIAFKRTFLQNREI